MGQLLAPFGVRGWVRVHPFTEYPDSLLDFPDWWVGQEGHWKKIEVVEAALHGKVLVACLEGVDDRDAAFALKGCQVAVPREQLPEPEADAYYWQDLVGLEVRGQHDVVLGHVSEVVATGANDVLVVKGDCERMIPFVAAYVLDVDLAAGCIQVDWDAQW